MDKNTEKILKIVADWKDSFCGAYSVRENGKGIIRMSTENIKIDAKEDKPGLDIRVKDGTDGETMYIPACVTVGGIDDLVYNDFYIGDNATVTIIAGCGVHTEKGEKARHNGIHRFFIGENSNVKYIEKHIGLGDADSERAIDPETEVFIGKNSVMEIDSVQIRGVSKAKRETRATVGEGGSFIVHERMLTAGGEEAVSIFDVSMDGPNSSVDLVSRSVARENSKQSFHSAIRGNASCSGHSECDAIITENGTVSATPQLDANNIDASLIHEAAIGKIAGEQLLKLCTFGLTEEEAEEKIIKGFLR